VPLSEVGVTTLCPKTQLELELSVFHEQTTFEGIEPGRGTSSRQLAYYTMVQIQTHHHFFPVSHSAVPFLFVCLFIYGFIYFRKVISDCPYRSNFWVGAVDC